MKVHKKVFMCIIIFIIYIPAFLCLVQFFTTQRPDAELKGFFDTKDKPTLTAESYVQGEFQTEYEQWLNTHLLPRALCTKIYNQIEYSCFDLGNRIIGKNGNIFEYDYIADAVGLEGYDYSSPELQAELQEYVNHLSSVQQKLEKYDKYLILYITPSKAIYNSTDIPLNYSIQKSDNLLRASDLLIDLLSETNVSYFDSRELVEHQIYPAFYSTGIHWARPLEQESTVAFIEYLKNVSGKNLRNLNLTSINSSNTPYWRDSDVYDLLNIFSPIEDITYYEYSTEREYPLIYDKARVLLQGGSFSEGFINDYVNMYRNNEISYINYSTFIRDQYGNVQTLETWDDLDLGKYLDNVDFIIIEMQEAAAYMYSSDFVSYLDEYLDSYTPQAPSTPYCSNFDATAKLGLEYSLGIWPYEADYSWSTDYSRVLLKNENITDNGLSVEFTVTDYLLSQGDCSLRIYANQRLIDEITILHPGRYKLDYDAKYFTSNADICELEIYCNNTFIPQEIGLNEDPRALSLMIHYIGEKR